MIVKLKRFHTSAVLQPLAQRWGIRYLINVLVMNMFYIN